MIELIDQPQKKTPAISYDVVYKKALAFFNGDELAATTWINKYALKDAAGNYYESSPDEMHRRMAKEFFRIESRYESQKNLNGSHKKRSSYGKVRKPLTEKSIYQYFKKFKYIIPQGSVMA
ncbi:MAG: ribonucleoside-diphosphate reductase, adenosylcobalamin-dependent, partial [Fulvivirga sp.]|nr:ribonucleoside-diphosphate reductase, adenosylcobalamin-dependent [Fulvivirga sp.]